MSYFKQIALGFEFSDATEITRKWTSDIVIFVSGELTPLLDCELDAIILELNTLMTDGVQLRRTSDESAANYHIFFGTATDYAELYPEVAAYTGENWGMFFVYWNSSQDLAWGHM